MKNLLQTTSKRIVIFLSEMYLIFFKNRFIFHDQFVTNDLEEFPKIYHRVRNMSEATRVIPPLVKHS